MRLVSADTGGGWRTIQKYVNAGIIEPYSIRNEPSPIFILHKIVQGFWPLELENGFRKSSQFTRDISNVSSYAFEGLTSLSDLIMNHISGKKLSQDSAYKITLDSKGGEMISAGKDNDRVALSNEQLVDENGKALANEVVGTAAQAHYGFVQDKVPTIMERSWDLDVELVVWTAHEAQGEDSVTNTIIRGPALVGKKGTAKIGRKVGMLIHAEPVGEIKEAVKIANQPVKVEQEITQVRYYFISHPDRNNPRLTWDAKPRVDCEVIPDLLKRFSGGFFIPTTQYGTGIDKFLDVEAELVAKGDEELLKWKESILNSTK